MPRKPTTAAADDVVTDFDVTLRPKTIQKRTTIGKVNVPAGLSEVLVNGKVIAHVCDHDSAPVTFCDVTIPECLRDEVVAKVAELRPGKRTRRGGSPPNPDAVAEIIQSLDPNSVGDLDDSDDREHFG